MSDDPIHPITRFILTYGPPTLVIVTGLFMLAFFGGLIWSSYQ